MHQELKQKTSACPVTSNKAFKESQESVICLTMQNRGFFLIYGSKHTSLDDYSCYLTNLTRFKKQPGTCFKNKYPNEMQISNHTVLLKLNQNYIKILLQQQGHYYSNISCHPHFQVCFPVPLYYVFISVYLLYVTGEKKVFKLQWYFKYSQLCR